MLIVIKATKFNHITFCFISLEHLMNYDDEMDDQAELEAYAKSVCINRDQKKCCLFIFGKGGTGEGRSGGRLVGRAVGWSVGL